MIIDTRDEPEAVSKSRGRSDCGSRCHLSLLSSDSCHAVELALCDHVVGRWRWLVLLLRSRDLSGWRRANGLCCLPPESPVAMRTPHLRNCQRCLACSAMPCTYRRTTSVFDDCQRTVWTSPRTLFLQTLQRILLLLGLRIIDICPAVFAACLPVVPFSFT